MLVLVLVLCWCYAGARAGDKVGWEGIYVADDAVQVVCWCSAGVMPLHMLTGLMLVLSLVLCSCYAGNMLGLGNI